MFLNSKCMVPFNLHFFRCLANAMLQRKRDGGIRRNNGNDDSGNNRCDFFYRHKINMALADVCLIQQCVSSLLIQEQYIIIR